MPAMPLTFEYDQRLVVPFMQALIPGFGASDGMQTIGVRRGGELVAGVAYEGINSCNAWMHVAAQPAARWLNRTTLRVFFAYPFVTCGLQRVSAYVNESNAHARKFDEGLGFKEEARLKGAADDGGDVILYSMWKRDCRYV